MTFDCASLVIKALTLYSIAEAQSGRATTVRIAAEGRRFSVSDDGRGHAVDRHVDGIPYLRLIYEQLQIPFSQGTCPAVQLQGIGASLVQALCSELTVTVHRNGLMHRVVFAEGQLLSEADSGIPSEDSGNRLEGIIRPELPVQLDEASLRTWLRDATAGVAGLRVELNGVELAPESSFPAKRRLD